MTFDDFDRLQQEMFDEIVAMKGTKGKEYAGTADRLANFKRDAEQNGVEPEVVCKIFGQKHLNSIAYFVKQIQATGNVPQQMSEPIKGRFVDAILYLQLLYALIVEREQRALPPAPFPPSQKMSPLSTGPFGPDSVAR